MLEETLKEVRRGCALGDRTMNESIESDLKVILRYMLFAVLVSGVACLE
jgi:hypothetical protein